MKTDFMSRYRVVDFEVELIFTDGTPVTISFPYPRSLIRERGIQYKVVILLL